MVEPRDREKGKTMTKVIRHMRRDYIYTTTLEDGRNVYQSAEGYLLFTTAK